MTAYPTTPGAPGQYPAQPTTTNVPAIISLICGILGCFVITPFIAIISGIIGVASAKPPKGGKGMAIGGIILGLLWIVGLGLTTYGVYFAVDKGIQLAKAPAIDVLNELAAGDVQGASEYTNMTEGELQALSNEVKPLGKVVDFSVNSFSSDKSVGGSGTIQLNGVIKFENGQKNVDVSAAAQGDHFVIEKLDLK